MVRLAAQHLVFVLCVLFRVSWAATPPFWPEENCLNQISTHDYGAGITYGAGSQSFSNILSPAFGAQTPAVNAYDAVYETHPYQAPAQYAATWYAGPMLNDTSTPCRLSARVGVPLSITVYAEDLDPGDLVRIYVLEDPGIPNGAFVTQDESHQRCYAKDPDAIVEEGEPLGPCPMCQSSGKWTYGFEHIPASPDDILTQYAKNYTANGNPCSTPYACASQSLPVLNRVWCMLPTGGRLYGDGKLEAESQHGRLRKRTLTWTPLPEQGICLHPTRCTFIVKFQAFDSSGRHSVIKTYEIDVIKALPQYSKGTFGLILNGAQERFRDPVTDAESAVSSTTYEPQDSAIEWMSAERVYKAYINCPLEFAIGVHANGYDVKLAYTSSGMPPDAKIEWRRWQHECQDNQEQAQTGHVWSDKFGRTCADYKSEGWCLNGAVGPNVPGQTFVAMARDGLVPADKACCECGAGGFQAGVSEATACSSRPSSTTCEDNLDKNGGKRVYPPQNGCKWHDTSCSGPARPYWVKTGVHPSQNAESAWSIVGDMPAARRVMGIFKWTPLRGMEGDRHRVCFKGQDVAETAPLPEMCSYLHVVKCRYCARVGETLKYVAEQYNFDTNWLRLWNYNYHITDPDMILRSFLPLTIGSTYKVQPGDTLARVAARLRTTVKKILEVNPDMHSAADIEVNQEVCVMPCTEDEYKDAPFNPYNGAAINGVPSGFVEQVPRLSKDPKFEYIAR